jgi:formylglycine-generating enzyme
LAGCLSPVDPIPDDPVAGSPEIRSGKAVSFTMRFVPAGGPFTMGEHVETPTQSVTLTRDFWMGETEVTQGLWEDVWGTTWPGTDPDGSGYGAGAEYPAYFVNWYDAVAFCNLLTKADDSIADTEQVYYSDAGLTTAYTNANAVSEADVHVDWSKTGYRLPTEAEWEYATRYIDGTSWNGGDHVNGGPVYTDETDPDKIGDYAWYNGNTSPNGGSKEVGQKTANALGLRDMSGNVYEWCYDWYAAYSGGSEPDPTGPTSGSFRVRRGGSWNLSGAHLRCARRIDNNPSLRYHSVGFRLCRTVD